MVKETTSMTLMPNTPNAKAKEGTREKEQKGGLKEKEPRGEKVPGQCNVWELPSKNLFIKITST